MARSKAQRDNESNTDVLPPSDPGARAIRVEVVDGPDAGSDLVLREGFAVIGTSADSQLRLSDSSVSSQHLRVVCAADGVHLTDMGSTNGTFYLDTRLRDATVPLGSTIVLGRSTIRLLAAVGDSPEGAAPTAYGALIGDAPAMRELFRKLQRCEQHDEIVLITGETGVGKELVADALHKHSRRKGQALLAFNCGAVPHNLAEATLFGHRRGAFTGAHKDQPGLFERARGGTLFLDEIGELPLSMQPLLLRVLESKQVTPVGGAPLEVDCRVVAATHRDLQADVRAGRFREDLYYRLNVVELRIPPLRERRADIPTLVHHLLAEADQTQIEMTAETIEHMANDYDWPGNVRELRNALARVLVLGTLPTAIRRVLPALDTDPAPADSPQPPDAELDLDVPFAAAKEELIARFEREYLSTQLARADNNLARAARCCGLDRSYFKRLLKRHDLIPKRDQDP